MSAPVERLRFSGVTVDFGVTRALASVDLTFEPGEIVGLLGHNGAGKSTLLNVATGAVQPSAGEIFIDGTPVAIGSPRQSARLGITVIHQTPALAANLSVVDNMFIGRRGVGTTRGEQKEARDALAQVGGGDIDLDSRVADLPLGQRQLVDLARGVMLGDVKILLLDEPTAALGKRETDTLHALIRTLADRGTTVIYVSHRLPDIVEVCDRVVILRDGAVVSEQPVQGLSSAKLSRDLAPDMREAVFVPAQVAEVVMQVSTPYDITFRKGEVVGLFGVAGGEQFRIFNALQGVSGDVEATLDGRPYTPRDPRAAIRQGVHTVVADRDVDGLILGLGAIDNVFAPWRGHRNRGRRVAARARARRAEYERMCEVLDIRGPGPASPMSAYSGGNRQKHLLAMWIYPVTPRLLLLAQPTQGVDVGAKADIRRVVRQAAADGMAVAVASAENDEIAGLCDRSYVVYGERCTEVQRSERFDADILDALLGLIPERGPLMTFAKLKIFLAQNGAIAALAVLVVFFTLATPSFMQPRNLETVLGSMAEIGLVAIPLALLVMSGSVDLSVGSIASLSAITSALVMTETGRVVDGVLIGLAVGLICGLINGVLVEYFKLNALVVTLGFLNVWGGMALFLSSGKTITGLPAEAREVAQFSLFGVVHLPILVLALTTIAAAVILNRRPFGRKLLAVGGNEKAAYLMGINVSRVRLILFVASGVGASMAGVLLVMKLGAASPNVGLGMEFSALTVVLLGGVAFTGGSGRITGVLAGLLFVGVLRNGLVLLGVSQFLQTVFVGLTLILAISLDKSLQQTLKSAWSDLAKKRRSMDEPPTGSLPKVVA